MRFLLLLIPALLLFLPAAAPQIAGCTVFPADNIWNAPVDTLPLDPKSAAYIDTIGRAPPYSTPTSAPGRGTAAPSAFPIGP